MHKSISRRDFLKMSSLSLGGLAFNPSTLDADPEEETYLPSDAIGKLRVGTNEIRIFKKPDYQSEVIGTRRRDQIIYYYEKINSPHGPEFNSRWYRLSEGYAHSAYLPPVETVLNPPVYEIPEGGQIAEITVPISLSFRYSKFYGWQPLYRLYYKSVHWVTGVNYGINLTPWYELTDDLLKITYWVPAKHMRLIPPEELTPIAPEVPPHLKTIQVNIKQQNMTAYEDGKVVLHTDVSTGIPGLNLTNQDFPSATPQGDFNINIKMPVRHMGDGQLTSDYEAYELPGVPWVSFFVETGVAFHGTYWHDNYGNEMSHGCVNMRPEEAKWLWRWVTPETDGSARVTNGLGTRVTVI